MSGSTDSTSPMSRSVRDSATNDPCGEGGFLMWNGVRGGGASEGISTQRQQARNGPGRQAGQPQVDAGGGATPGGATDPPYRFDDGGEGDVPSNPERTQNADGFRRVVSTGLPLWQV